MQLLSKEHALKHLDQAIKDVANIKDKDNIAAYGCVRSVLTRVIGIFGQESQQVESIKPLLDDLIIHSDQASFHARYVVEYLKALCIEVNEFWSDTGYQSPSSSDLEKQLESPSADSEGNRVFIVHGHDHGRMQALARFLEHLGLEPIILHERPNAGNTIIEKFEGNSNVAYAIVLLTPDDVGSSVSDSTKLQARARQNVILELGYFLARLGRKRTAALVVQGVEIPSDYSGILYIPIDKGDEWKLMLARELKQAGLKVDMNKAL